MAAINIIVLNSADKFKSAAQVVGEGVPADGDLLCTKILLYPIGSTYLNKTGASTTTKYYIRHAEAGVAADWKAITTA